MKKITVELAYLLLGSGEISDIRLIRYPSIEITGFYRDHDVSGVEHTSDFLVYLEGSEYPHKLAFNDLIWVVE